MIETGKELSSRTNSIGFFLTTVIPRVSRELKRWNQTLEKCPNWELLRLASSSLKLKKFHSQGGSFYSLCSPEYTHNLTALIVALQTISDYLDNLCDRNNYQNEAAFRYLHLAMTDAVSPGPPRNESYYRFYPLKDDGGYLNELVAECRRQVSLFPSYSSVKNEILQLVSLYNDLQTYKHMDPLLRKPLLKRWFRSKKTDSCQGLYWWEFAAACGSTLAVFALFALSTQPFVTHDDVKKVTKAYFPWLCGFHILLDYFIDQEEDLIENDFNFIACYPSPDLVKQRLLYFLEESFRKVSKLPNAGFHRTIIKGLLSVYLSDPKAQKPALKETSSILLKAAGSDTKTMHYLCLWLRRLAIL